MKHIYLSSAARAALGACLAAGALAACNQNSQPGSAPAPSAALPMEMTATAAAPIAPAPTVSELPSAPPVQVGRLSDPDDTYAYADEAYSENDAFGDAPPDYGFDYGGTQPWVWYGDDQSERVSEPLPGGGYRYYYYQPGAAYPYLVRDPDYSYGYDSGALVIVYDRYGHALPANQNRERIDAAGRILARAEALYAASRQQQHQAIVAANWEARQNRIAADNAAWGQAQAQQSGWAAYHAAHAQQEQAQWSGERFRREAEAARFAQATNQPQVAQRDWQAAQTARAQAPTAAPTIFGVHLGGPKPPAPAPAADHTVPTAPAAGAPNAHPTGEHAPPAPVAAGPAPAGPPAQGGGFDHHEHQAVPQAGTTQAPRPAAGTTSPSPEVHAAPARSVPPSATILHPAAPPARVAERPAVATPPAHPVAPPPKAIERPAVLPPRAEVVRAPPPVVHAAPPVERAPAPVVRPPPVRAAPPPRPAAAAPRPDDKRLPQ
jgi:hypothetical protein